VVAALAGLVAAWVAAGSAGLFAHPLRRALTLLFLLAAILVRRPISGVRPKAGLALLPFVLAVTVCMVALSPPVANTLAVAVVLAFLAFVSAGAGRNILLASSAAVVVFGAYRFAVTAIPWLWLAADFIGRGFGAAAGWTTGRPLWVGSAFAGLDFAVLTSVVWAIYLPYTKPPRVARAICGFLAIVGGHLIYLVLLSYVPDLLAAIPQPVAGATESSSLLQFIHKAVPWNLPALACGIHVLIVAAMFRWSASAGESDIHTKLAEHAYASVGMAPDTSNRQFGRRFLLALAAIFMAVLLPFVAVSAPSRLDLQGKKIVFYEKGFLNWLKPTHGSYGRLGSGMYGMLPVLLESLGAKCLISPELSDADIKDANVLAIIFPDDPWQPGQVERIHSFVRRGGSLLVLGEHTTCDPNGSNRFNEILAPTAMRVRFDCATFAVGGWLQSYEALNHPATAGIADDQNQFGVVIGASVLARWPARPLLVGRWGWTDDGDVASERAMMGNDRYDSGEKLGDIVLVAEQPLGKGRIIAFGDTSGLSNAIDVSSYQFTTRLFAYLANGNAHAHTAWRQVVALLAGAILIALVSRRPGPWKSLLVAVGLTASLLACTVADPARANLLPDGRRSKPDNLAYIDASHMETCSGESWRPDGLGGLALTLMRSGYLTLDLPEFTPERLERAGLLISVTPARAFSPAEVEMVKAFVNNGGTFILTTGYEQRMPCLPLLDVFGLQLGTPQSGSLEPEPLGHFKSPYLESEGKRVYVRFHAAWPLAAGEPNAQVIAYGRDNQPVIIMRRLGAGRFLLIGDPCFAMNMNLEYENGAPFEGLRENADFWRWLLAMIRGEPMWVPPLLQGSDATSTSPQSNGEPTSHILEADPTSGCHAYARVSMPRPWMEHVYASVDMAPGLERPNPGWHGQTRLPVGLRMGQPDRNSTVKQVWQCRPEAERLTRNTAGGSGKAEGFADGKWANHRQAALAAATQKLRTCDAPNKEAGS
jgi:hypothetical protein